MHVFKRHQLLFPMLLAMEMQREQQGGFTERELETLGKDLGSVDSQLELAGESSVSSLATKPPWIDDKVSNAMLCYAYHIASLVYVCM